MSLTFPSRMFLLLLSALMIMGGIACDGVGGGGPPIQQPTYQKYAYKKNLDNIFVDVTNSAGVRYKQHIDVQVWYKGAAPTSTKCLNLTVHGAGEGGWIYDMSAPDNQFHDNSYVDAVTDVCDVVTFDMPGTGESYPMEQDKDGLMLTADQAGFIIRQLIEIFTGSGGAGIGLGYSGDIYITGHSVGSIDVAVGFPYEPKVKGLILTGFIATPHPLGNGLKATDFLAYANSPFPKYSKEFWAQMAYYEPGLIEGLNGYGDNSHDMSLAQLQAGFAVFMNPDLAGTKEINLHVLLVTGDQDALYPAGYLENDMATMYPKARTLSAIVPINTGHATFLHKNSPDALKGIREWIRTHN